MPLSKLIDRGYCWRMPLALIDLYGNAHLAHPKLPDRQNRDVARGDKAWRLGQRGISECKQ